MAFKTKITKARYKYSPLTGEEMAIFAQEVTAGMWKRISSGINANDAPAKPLKRGKNGKSGYPEWKAARGIAPVRNWISPRRGTFGRIKLMRALKVKTTNENRAIIGFIDPSTDAVAHINNKLERMFGLSPKDKEAMKETLRNVLSKSRLISTIKVA